MNQKQKTTIILAGMLLIGVLICGFVGYINSTRPVSSASPEINSTVSPRPPALIKLDYCYGDAPSVCIISFGQDGSNNGLIVVDNANPSWTELYLRVKKAADWNLYECQKVQFSFNTFYCSGSQLQDGSTATIQVYAKNSNRLIASGFLQISLDGTPTAVPKITKTATTTQVKTQVKTPIRIATGTQRPGATLRVTPRIIPSRTRRPTPTPLYPNP